MGKEERTQGDIVYHIDTTSLGIYQTQFNLCFLWEEPLEQISNKEVHPHIVHLEPLERIYT